MFAHRQDAKTLRYKCVQRWLIIFALSLLSLFSWANSAKADWPTIVLVVDVDNTGGGTLTPDTAFGLHLQALSVSSGEVRDAFPNIDYVIRGTAVTDYEMGTWGCVDAAGLTANLPTDGDYLGTTLNLPVDAVVTCTVQATFSKKPQISLTKHVSNGSAGMLTASDFSATIGGNAADWGIAYEVDIGEEVTIAEANTADYAEGTWECNDTAGYASNLPTAGDFDDTRLTLPVGSTVFCSITNIYNGLPAPTVNLVVNVDNTGGGVLTVNDFGAKISGSSVASGEVITVTRDSLFTVSADDITDYDQSNWSCVDANDLTSGLPSSGPFAGTDLTLPVGAEVTCTMQATYAKKPELTLFKTVVNGIGGTATEDDFQAYIAGDAVNWGQAYKVDASVEFSISEAEIDDFAPSSWNCSNNNLAVPAVGLPTNGLFSDTKLTLPVGAEVSCAITNTYDGPPPPTITLEVEVDNTGGGTATPDDLFLAIAGLPATRDVTESVGAGSEFLIMASSIPDYTTGAWACTDANSIGDTLPSAGAYNMTGLTLSMGAEVTCVLAIKYAKPPELTLETIIVNTGGGTANQSDFSASIDGSVTDWSTSEILVIDQTYSIGRSQS